MNVFVQRHNGFIYLFFLELAVSFTRQEMTHKNLMSGSPQQLCSSEASGPDSVEAVTCR